MKRPLEVEHADGIVTARLNRPQALNRHPDGIEGEGFFQVLRPDGTDAYTRDGSFTISDNGPLANNAGYAVQPGDAIPNDPTGVTSSQIGVVSVTTIAQEKTTLESRGKFSLRLPREQILDFAGIAAVLLLAAWLRFSNLDSLGYVNHYYTAGVKSMFQSWRNFFYVAAEPGGSVTIDKPPVGLWLQVISAYFLGVNGFEVLLPELLAGIISVAILYHLVRRRFGILSGMLAALALAITPIVVATDRNNTIDSTLCLTLLLAAWSFIKATETGKLRFLLLGVTLVGIGFNIKMLQAYPSFLKSSSGMRAAIAERRSA